MLVVCAGPDSGFVHVQRKSTASEARSRGASKTVLEALTPEGKHVRVILKLANR